MTEPNATELANGTPSITLAGKEWPIPLLAFRQNKMVVPALVRIGKIGVLSDMTEATMNDLAIIIYTSLTRAHPTMTRNDFEELTISVSELVGAIDVIAKQTGVIVQGEAVQSGTKKAKTSTSIG